MKKTEKTVIRYLASDGQTFESKSACEEYEKELIRNQRQKQIREKAKKLLSIKEIDAYDKNHYLYCILQSHHYIDSEYSWYYHFKLPNTNKETINLMVDGIRSIAYLPDKLPEAVRGFIGRIVEKKGLLDIIFCRKSDDNDDSYDIFFVDEFIIKKINHYNQVIEKLKNTHNIISGNPVPNKQP